MQNWLGQIWTCVFAALAKGRQSVVKGQFWDNFEQPPYTFIEHS